MLLLLLRTPRTAAFFKSRFASRRFCPSHHDVRLMSLARPLDRPMRLAIVGAGPAGFYTAYRILQKLPAAKVDMYEALPVPYGLVRFGVAPDHPEVKNCQDKFAEVASSPNFTYLGNVPITPTFPLSVLAPHYDAVTLSYGASEDRQLGIPGEDALSGIYAARAFVGWYNGLPEYAGLAPDLSRETAVVVGQGNVALDVARILLSDPARLGKTDITAAAVDTLRGSRVKRVRIVGRRGPLQAAFTVKEIRELMHLPGVAFEGMAEFEHLLPPLAERKKLPRLQKRILEVLGKDSDTSIEQAQKSWRLDFLRAPKEFVPDSEDGTKLGAVRFEKQELAGELQSRSTKAKATGEMEDVDAGLAFRSIGYQSTSLPGFKELGIPFNKSRGLVPNEDGRVVIPLDASEKSEGSQVLSKAVPGIYVAGWVKRGPTGVIASTMYDAFETADAIVGDWETGVRGFIGEGQEQEKRGWEAVEPLAREKGVRRVSWEEWQKIDEAERSRGAKVGKEREKFASVEEMLNALD